MCVLFAGTQQKTKFYKKDKKTKNNQLLQPHSTGQIFIKYPFYAQARNRFFNLRKPIQDNKK